MKKLISACTAAAMLAALSVPAFAQASYNDKITFASSATFNEILLSEDSQQKERAVAKQYIVALEIYYDTFGKYLNEEEEAAAKLAVAKLEAIANGTGKYLSDEEESTADMAFLDTVFIYAGRTEQLTLDQQLADTLPAFKKDYSTLPDCDLKTYMGKLLSKDTTNMTDEEKNLYGSSLVTSMFFVRTDANFTIGDVNMDDKISSVDALTILRAVAKLEDLEDYEVFLSDVNSDGRVTSIDALIIQRHIAGYDTELDK